MPCGFFGDVSTRVTATKRRGTHHHFQISEKSSFKPSINRADYPQCIQKNPTQGPALRPNTVHPIPLRLRLAFATPLRTHHALSL